MSRSEARELFMQLLFQMEVQKDYGCDIKTKFFAGNQQDDNQKKYLESMYALVGPKLTEADSLIKTCSEHWKIGRMCKVDLATMRTAVLEIMFMDDIPDSVSINEAVEISKKYGTEDSGKFVNGVLGKIVKIKNAE